MSNTHSTLHPDDPPLSPTVSDERGANHLNDSIRPYPNSEDDEDSGDEDARAMLLSGPAKITTLTPQLHAHGRAPKKWGVAKGIVTEASPTLLIAVFGMVFSGELLERVSTWTAFQNIDELILLIPIIVGLKGNVEMNLSARLGTAANIGLLNLRSSRRSIIAGNMVLLQVQALVVSAVAAALAFLFGLTTPTKIKIKAVDMQPALNAASLGHVLKRQAVHQLTNRQNQSQNLPRMRTLWSWFREFFMVLTTAMGSASLSGLILGSFMCSVVLVCQRYRLNPDNIAPPMAAVLGDLLTLTLLALSSTVLRYIPSPIPLILLICLVVLAAILLRTILRHAEIKHLVYKGWTPLFGAMIISSGAGMVLENFVQKYEGYGLLATVISSLPGSIGAVSISRLSTLLHASGDVPQQSQGLRSFSFSLADYPPTHRPYIASATLFAIAVPVQLSFLAFVYLAGWMVLPSLFMGCYLIFFGAAVMNSLLLAHTLPLLFWKNGWDPDNYCMPIHSSLCDLSGNLLLVGCYELVRQLGTNVDLRPRR